MDFKGIKETINQIKDVAEIGEISTKDSIFEKTYKSFGVGNSTISFRGHNKVIAFEENINRIWKGNDDIYNTVARKILIEHIIGLIREAIQNKSSVEIEQVDNFLKALLSEPILDWDIMRPIYGVVFSDAPCKLGPFTIYNLKKHKSLIERNYTNAKLVLNENWPKDFQQSLISVRYKARHSECAKYFADMKFRQFEHVIWFMLAHRSGIYHVGIFSYRGWGFLKTAIFSKSKLSEKMDRKGSLLPVDLTEKYFTEPKLGHDRIWELLERCQLNALEKKVLTAIEWAGKGFNDIDNTKAFIQILIAIESLLSFHDKEIITPSIMSRIAEYTAFIVADTCDNRIGLYNLMRDLYSRRSAIVHGGTQDVTEKELHLAIDVIRRLIMKFLTDNDFRNLTKVDEMLIWVKKKKFT